MEMTMIKEHASSFTWKPSDIPGINPGIMTHELKVCPNVKPFKQKKRVYEQEKQEAMKDEVEKLNEVGFIREVMYP